jgi:hypothetical protein
MDELKYERILEKSCELRVTLLSDLFGSWLSVTSSACTVRNTRAILPGSRGAS